MSGGNVSEHSERPQPRGEVNMGRFSVTYGHVTRESQGEADSTGFKLESCTLKDAIGFLRWQVGFLRWQGGHVEANEWPITSPRWFTWYGEVDDKTGGCTNYSLHLPENATPSSRRRIARLLGLVAR